MMEDDLISCLTRQVKEDVIENYLAERRLIELQIEDFDALAQTVRRKAEQTGKRFTRMGFLMLEAEAIERLRELLAIASDSYWAKCLRNPFKGGVRFIQVGAFTSRAKFRKLVVEAYRRLCRWAGKYEAAHSDLESECLALNRNIRQFRNRFDLLMILNFLKNLDVCAMEQKHFLGENFTAEELSSVDRKLYIADQSVERFQLPLPPRLPQNAVDEEAIGQLAVTVYDRHVHAAKSLLR